MPARQFSRVVFPAPFGPSSATTCPGSSCRETFSSAQNPPNCLEIPTRETATRTTYPRQIQRRQPSTRLHGLWRCTPTPFFLHPKKESFELGDIVYGQLRRATPVAQLSPLAASCHLHGMGAVSFCFVRRGEGTVRGSW